MTDVDARPDRPTHTERTTSLNAVRDIIPQACYQRSAGRAALALVQAALLWLLPIVALAFTDTWYLLVPLWLLAGFAVSGLFVLGHDASHGALTGSRRANRLLAQLCMGPSAHVEAAWDLGHNRIHHGYTTREGFDFVWHPLTPAQYAELGRVKKLQHRLEWSWAGSGVYFLRSVWWQKMWRYNPEGKRRDAVVRDKLTLSAATVAVVGGVAVVGALSGGWTQAVWMPVKLFVIPFLIFVHVIGWTVYVHHVAPDIRWWNRREWTQFKGQMESTTIIRMPRLVNRLWLHNIMVHVPHHVDARIPFHQLPAAADAIAEHFPDTVRRSKVSMRGYLRTTKACKLYDFERGCWLGYDAARVAA